MFSTFELQYGTLCFRFALSLGALGDYLSVSEKLTNGYKFKVNNPN